MDHSFSLVHFLHLAFGITQSLGLSSISLVASFQSPLLVSSLPSSSCWNDLWLSSQWSSQSTLSPLGSSSAICMAINTIFVATSYIYTLTFVSLLNSKHVHLTAYLTSSPIWHCQLPCPKLTCLFSLLYSVFPSQLMSILSLYVFWPKILVSFIIPLLLWHATSNVSSSPVGTIFTHIQNLTTYHHVYRYHLCWSLHHLFPKLLQWLSKLTLCLCHCPLQSALHTAATVVLWKWNADHVKLAGFTESKQNTCDGLETWPTLILWLHVSYSSRLFQLSYFFLSSIWCSLNVTDKLLP